MNKPTIETFESEQKQLFIERYGRDLEKYLKRGLQYGNSLTLLQAFSSSLAGLCDYLVFWLLVFYEQLKCSFL